ncbi:transmembrane 4 L6 family member 1-like [Meleagris gallopavo]|uniref:transmembrane 4 L6 family member 1-like n=1 Tax=Meleagris gallopavo TaxID=9103 RepID=UPI00054998F6|nr:transmembrane 4 L6 family member 1-like [Meleagris gallopavo]
MLFSQVVLPAFMMLGAGGAGCCANRCGMLLSVLLALLGFAGAVYCAVFSSMGLIGGPLCDTGDGEYLYPFRNNTLEYNYLFNQTTWSICKEPENIILWNIVLFSVLLAIGVIEAILCLIQVTNGLIGFVCGTCMRRRKTNISGM